MHALLVQVNIDHLKRLNILLSSLAFFFCFFGTFITRSGLMSSVHSFAESRVGPDYLIFLVGILIFTIALYILRATSILPSNIQKQWEFTRESVMVVAQFILRFLQLLFSLDDSTTESYRRAEVQCTSSLLQLFCTLYWLWTWWSQWPWELHALSEKEYPSWRKSLHMEL